MKFVKYKKIWWQVSKNTPLNSATIRNYDGVKRNYVDITDLPIVEAESFDDLDWYDTKVWDPNSSLGWLDREGNFYGCGFACHDDQARFVHKTNSLNLEILGWIHISSLAPHLPGTIFAQYYGDYREGVIPTDKQLQYLLDHPKIEINSVKKAVENGNYTKAQIYESNLKNKQKDKNNDKKMEL